MQTKLVLKQQSALKLRFQPGATGPAGDVTVGTTTTGAPGSSAAVANSGTPQHAVLNFTIPRGDVGATGDKGWSPILAIVTDGTRRVLQIADWTGGQGTKPAAGSYIGATGLVSDIASAVDIRGAQGPSGSVTDGDKGDIVVSGLGSVWTIDANAVDTAKMADKAITLAKQADVATGVILGRQSAGTGSQEALTATQARSVIGVRSVAIGEIVRGQFTSLPALCLWANGQNVSRTTYALLLAATTISGTVSINATTTATLTLADAEAIAQVQVGMPIEATGIQAGTTIAARGTATSTTLVVTLSLAATTTASANASRIFPSGNGDGSTTFGVADYRDRAAIARGNIGGTAASRLTAGVSGINSSRLGTGGGDERTPQQNLSETYGTGNNGASNWVGQVPGDVIATGGNPALSIAVGAGTAGNVQPSIIENVAIYAGV